MPRAVPGRRDAAGPLAVPAALAGRRGRGRARPAGRRVLGQRRHGHRRTGHRGSRPAAGPAGPAPATLAQYYAQHLSWQPCDHGFQCARLAVPFDYAHPAGKRFSLPVVKLAASDPARRVGALVVNPGGPGGSGVSYALGRAQRVPGRAAGPVRHRGLRPARGGGQPARAGLHDRPAARRLPGHRRHAVQRRAAGQDRGREQASTRPAASRTPGRCCRTSAPRTRPATWTCSAPRSARPS